MQLRLADYAAFYKGVHEMLPDERPTDDVINNDAELDKYLEDLERKRAQDMVGR
jgi:hypothetical protein